MIAMNDDLKTRISQRLAEIGLSRRDASLRAGGSESLVSNILLGKSENPRYDTLVRLAEVLGVTPGWLTGAETERPATPSSATTPAASEVRSASFPQGLSDPMPRNLPVFGTVAGGELGDGSFQLTPDVVEYVRRPPALAGAPDAYALYVEGESMVPKFEPGDLVFVHPGRKPLPGDYVVIQEPDTRNGEPRSFIKKLVRILPATIKCTQFNPPATLDFMNRPGTRVHKVIHGNDLFGF